MSNSAEKQYYNDSKLEHIILDNVLFYKEDKKKFYTARLEIFGQSSCTYVYEKGELIETIKKSSFNDESNKIEMEYSVVSEEKDCLIIKLENSIYSLSYLKFEKLVEYYNQINKNFIEQRIEFKNNIEKDTSELLINEDVKSMLFNYFSNIPPQYFMDFDLIAGVEYELSSRSKVGNLLLIMDKRYRESLIETEQVKENGKVNSYDKLKNYSDIYPYIENYFDMLVKVIDNKYKISNYETALFLTYNLLNRGAMTYYSKIWKEQYGEYFSDLNILDLVEVIRIYCNIDCINPDNLITGGHFIYYLMNNMKFDLPDINYITCFNVFVKIHKQEMKNKKLSNFETKLTSKKEEVIYSIDDIDLMGGIEFENFIALMFSKMGYSTTVTKSSGDQGIDIIAEKNGKNIGIQAKCYSSQVTNSAIQEVVAGIKHYNLNKAIVVTNNYFTKSAQELAESNGVVLWDRNMLKEKLVDLF